jgi:hypothetical protein
VHFANGGAVRWSCNWLLCRLYYINVGDEQRQTGRGAHTARGSGNTEGVPVTFTVVSVVKVI